MPAETKGYVAHGMNKLRDDAKAHVAMDPEVVDAARTRVTNDALNRSMPGHLEARPEVMAASDHIAAGRMPIVEPLSIEQSFAMKLRDFDAAKAEYATLKDSEGGKVLNTDVVRELSPDYMKDRSRAAEVHEPASDFTKRLYADKLAEMKQGDMVMFMAGGTGAGKTTAIGQVPEVLALKEDAHLVYDTNMNKFKGSVEKIDQALAAGAGAVHIVHVMREPVDALVHGALARAARQEKELGTGRTVPLQAFADAHRGSADTVPRIAEHYKDDPRVTVHVVDNTRGRGGAALSNLDFIRQFDYNGLEGRLHEALNAQRDAGAISENVFRATQGDAGASHRPPVRSDAGQQPQPADRQLPDARSVTLEPELKPVAEAGPISPESQRVTALAEANPNLTVRLPGSDETLTIAVALERAKAAAAEEAGAAKLVQAALECALGFGG